MWNFFLKNCKNYIQKWILQVIFSNRCSNCLKTKIVHNFHITNPNRMNKNFRYRQKYNPWKKIQKTNSNLQIFVCCHLSIVFNLWGHNFCFGASIEKKIYFHENDYFHLPILFQKIMTKNKLVGTYPKSHLSLVGTMVL